MAVDHDKLTELFTEAMDLSRTEQAELVRKVGHEDPELAKELAALLTADDSIVTALRTAGLKPDDASAGFRIQTVPAASLAIPGYQMRGGTLGSGGMGVVYDADQIAPPRRVAIKVLHVASAEAHARFLAEAQIMKRLAHPGIASIIESGEANGHPFIVMELVDGETLDKFVAKRSPALGTKLAVFAQICDAVAHAHGQGVIHRDLKPTNILVRRLGGVAICDFGIAREATSNRTQPGDFLGTLTYMSPEQARGRTADIDGRADVYSLGVILFELVTGQPPHVLAGMHAGPAVRVITTQPAPPLGSGDPALDALVARALAKDQTARIGSAAELAAAVRAIGAAASAPPRP